MNRTEKTAILREGFTRDLIVEKIQPAGKWVVLEAMHQSDFSNLTLPADVDYKHTLYHEVLKIGPEVRGLNVGQWVVVIKNALDGLTADHRFVACQEEDAILRLG